MPKIVTAFWKFTLILLDIMLPGMDGLDVMRELARDTSTRDVPILMLTAKGEEMDRIVGLELGCEDYVVKPFNMRELLLRMRVILRRRLRVPDQSVLSACGIWLDAMAHRVTCDGKDVALTATEFRLLEDLLRNKGSVRTREQLLDSVWGYQFDGYARTVDTHVRRLRGKLGDRSACIETVRGVGYRFGDGEEDEEEA